MLQSDAWDLADIARAQGHNAAVQRTVGGEDWSVAIDADYLWFPALLTDWTDWLWWQAEQRARRAEGKRLARRLEAQAA